MTRLVISRSVDCPATQSGTFLRGDRVRVKGKPPMPLRMNYHDFSGAPASSLDDIGVIKTRAWDISRDEPAGRISVRMEVRSMSSSGEWEAALQALAIHPHRISL